MIWDIDPEHTTVAFSVRHMMISTVRGEFRKLGGSVRYDPDRLAETSIEASIDAASIDTHDPDRDANLRSAAMLDVERFPAIVYVSRSVEPAGKGALRVAGDLTIRDVTRTVVLSVERPRALERDARGDLRLRATAEAKIRRSDFGLLWNAAIEAGGVVVADSISIALDVGLRRRT